MSRPKKPKAVGRPKLPKAHAKAHIVPVRFKADALRRITAAAKANNQTVSGWIRSTLEAAGMKQEIYRGHKITVRSAPMGKGSARWRTEVQVSTQDGATETARLLPPPPADWSAATRDEADEYGFDRGRTWVDRR